MPAGRAGLCVNKLASVFPCQTLQSLRVRLSVSRSSQVSPLLFFLFSLSVTSFIHRSASRRLCDPGSSADSLCRIAQSCAVVAHCAAAAALQQRRRRRRRRAPPMLAGGWLFKNHKQRDAQSNHQQRKSSKSVHSQPGDHQPGWCM